MAHTIHPFERFHDFQRILHQLVFLTNRLVHFYHLGSLQFQFHAYLCGLKNVSFFFSIEALSTKRTTPDGTLRSSILFDFAIKRGHRTLVGLLTAEE